MSEAPFNVHAAMRARYPQEAYALMFEVRNATGFQGSRSADALVMGLYPSRGLELEGFEFKASRSDWLSELKDPAKAEEISQYCDRWWVVATKPGIVKKVDLPPTWGLLVPGKKGLKIQVRAPQLENPKQMTKSFMASIFREVQRQSSNEARVEAEVDKRLVEAKGWRIQALELRANRAEEQVAELKKMVKAFEDASGVRLSVWQGEGKHANIGTAVKMVVGGSNGLAVVRRQAEGTIRALDAARRKMTEALGELEPHETGGDG